MSSVMIICIFKSSAKVFFKTDTKVHVKKPLATNSLQNKSFLHWSNAMAATGNYFHCWLIWPLFSCFINIFVCTVSENSKRCPKYIPVWQPEWMIKIIFSLLSYKTKGKQQTV